MKKFKRAAALCAALCLATVPFSFAGCAQSSDTVTLRVCSWEEYIDLGGWDEEERIEIENNFIENPEDGVFGENEMVEDFTKWFNANHDYNIEVEYSTFGTNEDLYNRLSLGDVYDLVCPSDYMMMKLIAENAYVEYSDGFWDTEVEENYYAKYVSRYIDSDKEGEGIFNNPEYNWHKKAACYMWGTTGLVYNPNKINDVSDVSTWSMLLNSDYARQVTIKDNVRDSYFAALGIVYNDLLTEDITPAQRAEILNNVQDEAVEKAEDVLKKIKDNVYSFETDSGKADMVTGKVVANFQWSGDAVFIMDTAEEDGYELWYSVPEECTNLWFDGWLMLKNGIGGDSKKQEAAEAFVNYLSRPDNAIRNMYYIGYSSAIADDTVFDYVEYNYAAEEDEETYPYDVSNIFKNLESGREAVINAPASNFDMEDGGKINRGRQLFAQYPPQNVIERSVVMLDFGNKLADLNQMWINVRCLDLKDISPVTVGIVAGMVAIVALGICLYIFRYKIFYTGKPKKGYKKVG